MHSSPSFDCFIKTVKSARFFCVWWVLMVISYLFIDKPVALFFQPHDFQFYGLYDELTLLGYPSYFIAALVTLSLVSYGFLKRSRITQSLIFMLSSLVLTTLAQSILKILLGRARPVMLFEHNIFGFQFLQTTNEMWSLPSGLITTDTALLIALCYIFPRYWVGFIIVLLGLSFSRLVVTVHFVSDTMATMYIMTLLVIVLAEFCQKRRWLLWN